VLGGATLLDPGGLTDAGAAVVIADADPDAPALGPVGPRHAAMSAPHAMT